jgi:hypothetical protein
MALAADATTMDAVAATVTSNATIVAVEVTCHETVATSAPNRDVTIEDAVTATVAANDPTEIVIADVKGISTQPANTLNCYLNFIFNLFFW